MPTLPYRLIHRNGLLNTVVLSPILRLKLAYKIYSTRRAPDAITVIIGIRNRSDYRLRNALWSIRNQSYPQGLIKIVVVDYGSDAINLERARSICQCFDATIIPLNATGPWNKSKCMNYAIKRCDTKFLLSTDVDVIFPPQYFSAMIKALQKNALSAIYSKMLDLPEHTVSTVKSHEEDDTSINFDLLSAQTTARGSGHENAGINGSFTFFYQYIHGYDEFYEGWGSEDNDLLKRFIGLGLDIQSISTDVCYFHQWHPKGEGIEDFSAAALRNREYYENSKSIIRNVRQWGEVK